MTNKGGANITEIDEQPPGMNSDFESGFPLIQEPNLSMLENLDLLSQIACQNNIDKLDISEQRAQVLSSVLGGVGVCSQKGLRDLRLEVLLQIKSIAASQYLQRQTFHLTIVYYDCFLAHYLLIITHQNKFAAFDKARDCLILALTCLHIAQKFNESQQLELDQLIYIAND